MKVGLLRGAPSPAWGGWIPFAAGAAAGFLAAALVGRARHEEEPDPGDRRSGAEWPRLAEAWEGAVEGLSSARDYVLGSPELDLDALRERLAALPGGGAVTLGALGPGLVELMGTAPDEERAERLLEAVAAEPGVEVVVNRIWTPSSGGAAPKILTDPS